MPMKKRGLQAPLLLFLLALSVVEGLSAPACAGQTKVWSAPKDLEGAAFENTAAAGLERGLAVLAAGPDGAFASSGTVTLPALPAPRFDALVASWNADTPPGTSVE